MQVEGDSGAQQHSRRIYLDYAAATPLDPDVLEVMTTHLRTTYGNAGGLHTEGRKARAVLSHARERVAACLGAHTDEIVFTGSGTESNNLAICGTISALEGAGRKRGDLHAITSSIEHPSVLDCFHALEAEGVRVTYLSVDREGRVDLDEFRAALAPETVLVSVMYANNEIGTVQPVADIARIIQEHRRERGSAAYPYFHTDASQTPLFLPVSMDVLHADCVTYDAQKIHGPKGVGALYRRRGVALAPILIGGNQEYGLRPGTENVPTIAGFALALERAVASCSERAQEMAALRDHFIAELKRCVPAVELNGHPTQRIANNVNVSVPGMDNEFMVISLDERGVACGTKSACIRDGGDESYVIRALGKGRERATSSLRFTLGTETAREDLTYTAEMLGEIVRVNSPSVVLPHV